jgi:hypothetical protein
MKIFSQKNEQNIGVFILKIKALYGIKNNIPLKKSPIYSPQMVEIVQNSDHI